MKRIKPKQNTYRVISANDYLASDPTDETRQGVPSHFQATLDQLEQLYDGLQLHYHESFIVKAWRKYLRRK